jgi:6-phosphogluconate dehydrogenase (decarboxylating)
MQAYAEGFDIMRGAGGSTVPKDQRYPLDLADIAELWRRGSVVGSWLLDLTAQALAGDASLKKFTGKVERAGNARRGAVDFALRPLPLASGQHVRREASLRHALPVRRARREEVRKVGC